MPRGDERAARRTRRTKNGGDDTPDLERRAAWLAEDWHDVPEFAAYRDVLLLFRLAAEPTKAGPPALRPAPDAALLAPRMRFLHLDFSKKNARFVVTMNGRRQVPGMAGVKPCSAADVTSLVVKLTPGPPSAARADANVAEDAMVTAASASAVDDASAASARPTAPDARAARGGDEPWARDLVLPEPFLDASPAEEDVLLASDDQLDTFGDTVSLCGAACHAGTWPFTVSRLAAFYGRC